MTQDEILAMAREAGEATGTLIPTEWNEPMLERFAALAAAHERKLVMDLLHGVEQTAILAEREACAKVCDAVLGENNVSAAIRARSEK